MTNKWNIDVDINVQFIGTLTAKEANKRKKMIDEVIADKQLEFIASIAEALRKKEV